MRRAATLTTAVLLLAVLATGCREDNTVNVSQVGIEVGFTDCLVFGVHIFVDGAYQGTATSERRNFYPLNPGSYTLFARSNANLGNVFFCWERSVTVTEGNMTAITLSCKNGQCSD